MPFSRCARCQGLFVVGSDGEAPHQNQCPRCGGGNLEPVSREEVRQRIREQDTAEEDRSKPDPETRGELLPRCA